MRDIEIYEEEVFQEEYPEVVEIAKKEADKFEIDLKDFYFAQFEGFSGCYMVLYVLEEDDNRSFAVDLERTDKGWNVLHSSYEED